MSRPQPSPMPSEPEPWRFAVTHPVEVRFRDTDAMGHVNNACYVTYLEVARQAYWERLTGDSNYQDIPFILARVEVDFRSPAYVGETLEVGIGVEWIGTRSFAFGYRIREGRSRRLVAEALTIQAVYDYRARKSMPMPADLRAQVERFEGRTLPGKPA